MEKSNWLIDNGVFLGNALLSGIGLAFAIGAPVISELRVARRWWVILWASLLGFYLWQVLVSLTSSISVLALMPLALFNGSSTVASAMLYLLLREKSQISFLKAAIASSFILLVFGLSGFISITSYDRFGPLSTIIANSLAWVFFVLLAWNYRTTHMSTTMLLLAYANLQLPAGIISKGGLGNDLVLLLAAKLSLIGAMYHMLGIRDANLSK